MSIASSANKATILLAVLFCAAFAEAHPVAQGALLATVSADTLLLEASISTEEVLIGTLDLGETDRSNTERLQRYGEYLLEHVRILADGRHLVGRVIRVPRELREPLQFDLEYSFSSSKPQELEFSQNALREFAFAPGNPWEARYLLRVNTATSSASTVLLKSEDTVTADCEWNARSVCAINRPGLGAALVVEGIRHILTGYDHLLFIAALLLAVGSMWDLIKVISVFTLAHSLTLMLATFGIVRLSPGQIEPVIALSIVAVAAQNIFWPSQSRGPVRLAIAFGFGLFHGLGFAGGLVDAMAALSLTNTLWALVAFSLGIEIGHQLVVLPLFAALYAGRRYGDPRFVKTVVPQTGSLVIGAAGVCYLALSFHV